jgi:archaellum component FlaC
MSYENERDDEDEEYRPPRVPSMPPPSATPPLTPPPTGAPPSEPPLEAPPPSYYEQPTYPSTSEPLQEEYNAILSQVQERDSAIGQLQSQVSQYSTEVSNLRAQLNERNNQVNRLNGQLQTIQSSVESYQNQVNQLTNENAQLRAQLPGLQQQVQELQQHNSMLQQQIGPLQSQVAKLQQEIAYKEKRIEELKEPKAVMPSSLAQGITSQTSGYGTTPSFGPSSSPTIPSESSTQIGTGRRVCPSCGASGFAVKEVEDKTRIISYIPKPTYAKKYVCTKCGFEF